MASSGRWENARGTTRPSHLFDLTPEVEQVLSKAYVPVLTHLVDVFAESLPAQQVETLLRRTGTALANEVSPRKVFSGGLKQRVGKASELMNEHLGALTHVEGNGGIKIRGASCPLSALTGKHPGVCLAIETFVSEIVGVQYANAAIATIALDAVLRFKSDTRVTLRSHVSGARMSNPPLESRRM